ncbi:MAG: DUF11 domain-containing protein, partial [Kiritimatiellae bacterium]|nr:DUF11 domain-containing protein [Kiritimatiellia bacterium]
LGRGTNETIWDAGMYVPPSTLGDWAWYDANTNGIQDAGESGATNVVIRLYDGSTNLVATTNTDSAGYYAFYGLVPGPYFLEVVPPPDYTLTQPDQGGSDTNDSDFAKDSQRTPVFDLPPGTNYLMWDAGFIPAMPGLKITKTSDWAGPDCWGAGDTITYTITVENTGIVGHAITTVTDPEPQGVTYVTNSTWVVAPTEGVTNTVRDEFNAVAYTNNDGTVDWAGDWVENDPYGAAGPVGDYVGVTGGRLFLHYAYVDDESAQRSADLTGSSSAAFGFEWETVGLDAGETISILVSTNSGGTFVTLDTLGGTASGSTNYDVSAYISADTTVRFVNQSQNWESGEYAYFDNVQIEFSSTDAGITTNAGGPPPTLAEGYTLKTGETMTITFEVTVDSPPDVTAITNTATVTSETQPPISASVTDCVVYADLAVTKTVSDPNPSETQSIEYQVIVTNNGPNDTTGVELTDVLPEGVQYHSHSNGVYNEITGIWSIGALAVGGTTTLYVNVTVDEGLGGATVTNWGCITHSDLYDPVETNNQDDAEFTPQYTFVLLSRFRAFAEDGAVVVEWETAAELGTIGFRVYREGTDGTWSTVHEGLLPSTLRPEGGTYRLVDRSAVIGGTHRYQLEEVEARGRSCLYGPFEVAVEGQGGGASRDVSAARKAGRGRSEPFARTGKTMGSDKAARVAERKDARDRWWDLRKRMKGNLAKVTVTEEGVYYVGAEALAEVLDMPLDTVKKMLQVRRMVLSNRGEDAAYVIAAGGEGLYFYGEKLDSIYTDRNVYWLGYGRGKPHETAEGHWPAAAPGGVFQDTIHVEENHLSVTAVVDDPEEDFWMWGYVFGGAPGSDTHAMDVVLPDAAATGSASVVVKLQGGSRSGVSPEHHVRVRVNGIEAGEATWTGTAACRFEAALDASLLVEGTNRVEVQALLGEGVPYSVVYVDCADIRYPRHYRARGGALKVRGDGNAVITVGGFGSGDISVVEVTQPHALGMMRGASVEADGTGGQWRVSFAAEAPEREYVAFEAPGLKTPESIVAAVRTKLAQSGNQGEYTIITTPELVEAAEVLADYRAGQGYKTEVVDLESIYDVFNYGIESPQAIRDFLYFAYYFWVQPPQYVVLAGEGTFDYKDHLGYADNLVPVKMMPTPYGLLESDSWYGDIAGDDGVPEIPVGRLPVMTSAELEAMAAKMEAYESGGGDWAKTLLMVADDPDDAGDFPGDSDDLGMLVPGGYVKDRIYLSERTLENARAALLGGLDSGALLVSYIGHGAMDRLAAEGLLTTADVSALDNGERLPVVLGMTCLAGRFGVPGFDCLAEELLLKPDGGAVAVWSPTGLSMNTLAKRLAEGFFLSRFTDGETVLGNISQSAFEDYGMGADPVYMLYIYNLLGDPALRVK